MNILNGLINLFRFDRTNWKAVALCLIAATVFWFFNALNKEHTATISFPVDFQYNQATFIPVKALPQNVKLNITGSGWDLLRKSLGFKVVPLLIELERPVETQKISPTAILALAATQFSQTKINHVASDTLMLSLEPKKSKKVKLALRRNQLRFELGFGISSPLVILPDSVQVDGPASAILKMPDSILLPFPPGRVSNNVKEELEIKSPVEESIVVSPNMATVMFEVSELADVKKKIKVIVLPATPFRHQVAVDSISVNLRLPITQLTKITNAAGLFAVIDLRALEPGVAKVMPMIKGLPNFSFVVSADSVTVRKY